MNHKNSDNILVKVVIPLYKTDLNEWEYNTLQNNIQVLSAHKIVVVCPENLEVKNIHLLNQIKDLEVQRFKSDFFKGISGYNKLMVSPEFYERFLNTDFILICQTDAFIFRDELISWCNKNYAYIGAPWIASKNNLINIICRKISDFQDIIIGKKPKNREHFLKVGNGGLSLRKVKIHYQIAMEFKDWINEHINQRDKSIYNQEDIIWSLKAKEFNPNFNIPTYLEAVSFAIDRKPELAFKLNNNQLPFGCHGFNKKKVKKFWSPILKKYLGSTF